MNTRQLALLQEAAEINGCMICRKKKEKTFFSIPIAPKKGGNGIIFLYGFGLCAECEEVVTFKQMKIYLDRQELIGKQ